MKKILYYVVEKEISSDGESLNGIKTITVYEIKYDKPQKLTTVEGSIEDESTDLIQDYLNYNGMGDDFEFKQL